MVGLQEKRERLLAAIAAYNGEWVKRADIARHLGLKKLSSGEITLLEVMASEGVIEAREAESKAPIGKRAEYRPKQA